LARAKTARRLLYLTGRRAWHGGTIAAAMLADSGHVAYSTVYEAWIRLHDLVNLYLAGGHVPGP
jgi:hypothetical protein